MKGRRKWLKRHLDQAQDALGLENSTNDDEMTQRAHQALSASIEASAVAQKHAEEAQRLFGAIRREIAVTQARKKAGPA